MLHSTTLFKVLKMHSNSESVCGPVLDKAARVQMQFTCNRCTTRNVIEVNPHAYHAGSVFVQCGGCKVRHKLVDHLNVAREYNLEQDGEYVTAGGTAEDRVRAVMSERMLPKPF